VVDDNGGTIELGQQGIQLIAEKRPYSLLGVVFATKVSQGRVDPQQVRFNGLQHGSDRFVEEIL
jgi:hypothetical protein